MRNKKATFVSALSLGLALGAPASWGESGAAPIEEAVEFAGGAEGVTLAGTLLLPAGASAEAPVAGVVLVTGSGVQDRDETVMGRKPFKALADAMAARGYAVLRYDDRGSKAVGVGQSTGDARNATLADTSEDAARAVEFLAARGEVADERVVVCGHSTGGLEAAMLLGADRVRCGAILLASPGVPGSALVIRQAADILRVTHTLGRSGMTDEQVARADQVQAALITAAVEGDPERFRAAAEDAVRFGMSVQSPGAEVSDEALEAGVRGMTTQLEQPWMAHFLRYDPAPDLMRARVPVLAVFGGRDLQVTPAINALPVTGALTTAGHPRSLVATMPRSNHLFQNADTGLLNEYGTLRDEMNPELIALVCTWLDGVTRP